MAYGSNFETPTQFFIGNTKAINHKDVWEERRKRYGFPSIKLLLSSYIIGTICLGLILVLTNANDTFLYLLLPLIIVAATNYPPFVYRLMTVVGLISALASAQSISANIPSALANIVAVAALTIVLCEILNHLTYRRMLYDQQLRQRDADYRWLANNLRDVIWTATPQKGLTFVSSSVEHMLGYTREETQKLHLTEIISTDTLPAITAFIQNPPTDHNDTILTEIEHVKKDGTTIPAEVMMHIIRNEDGNPISFIGVSRDISERKAIEQRKIELMLEKERMDILSKFITQASHEFRTPLTILNTNAHMLEQLIQSTELKKYIESIIKQSKSITTLVEALTLMSKLDGTPELDKEQVNVGNLIHMVTTSEKNLLSNKEIEFVSKLDSANPIMISGDNYYLHIALKAIMDNAVQATDKGGMITTEVNNGSDKIIIKISDNGTGISEDDLPYIFERFYRSDKVGTSRGFGLGLPIARSIIELHQGKIEVESTAGAGSTFSITLPTVAHS